MSFFKSFESPDGITVLHCEHLPHRTILASTDIYNDIHRVHREWERNKNAEHIEDVESYTALLDRIDRDAASLRLNEHFSRAYNYTRGYLR